MAGFDELIRSALLRQGDATADQRAAIYRSSRQALDRMLEKNPAVNDALAATQRSRLEQAIRDIEGEYAKREAAVLSPPAASPAVENPAESPVASPPPPIPSVESGADSKPAGDAGRTESVVDMPTVPLPAGPETEKEEAKEPEKSAEAKAKQDYDPELLKEQRSYGKLLLWTIILASVGVCLWWAVTFGPALLQRQLDGSVPNPRPVIESGAFVPGEEDAEGWVSVFSAEANPENIDFLDRGAAELIRTNGRTYARLASNPGDGANTIRIKVPLGVIESLRGKAVTFELILRGSPSDGHQFAVFCEFGAMGSCGRKRFNTRSQVDAYIFDALVNDAALASGEDAHIAINTDMALEGKSVDLFTVRVRTRS